MLVDAAKHTAFFAGDEGLGGEIIDTVIKAFLHETRVHLSTRTTRSVSMVAFNGFFFLPPKNRNLPEVSPKNPNPKDLGGLQWADTFSGLTGFRIGARKSYRHKFLHLFSLHASGQLALLGSIQSSRKSAHVPTRAPGQFIYFFVQ